MYRGGVTFYINKSFATLQLIPEQNGLRLYYVPIENDVQAFESPGFLNFLLPLEGVGGLWATARAFLYGVESLDENVVVKATPERKITQDVIVKLYRDRPKGEGGKLSGQESCWLRIVNGRSEEERRRIKLGPRDLLAFELACQSVMTVSAVEGHKPVPA